MIWKIAFRNLQKNARRTIATALAIGVSGLAALLMGGFVTTVWYGLQTSMIQEQGNIQIYRKGYLEYGVANPADYTIKDWKQVVDLIGKDPVLSKEITVITPRIDLSGVAGNVATGNSKTFIGQGVIAADVARMRHWDGWNIGARGARPALETAPNSDKVVIGVGMARMMGLCQALAVPNPDCKDAPEPLQPSAGESSSVDVNDLIASDSDLTALGKGGSATPQLNLLAATSRGAPNIIQVKVAAAQRQGLRVIDNAFVMLPFAQARNLLFGDSPEATVVMAQLQDPERANFVKARIQSLFDAKGLNLNAYHLLEVDQTFASVFGMFAFIFVMVSAVLALVIVFTIVNTVSMTIVERIKEIGTIRALGFRQGFVRRLFLAESALTGVFGAALALISGTVLSELINAMRVQWMPPSNAVALAVRLTVFKNPLLPLSVVIFLVLIAVLAAILPTFRASRLSIVESLHLH